MANFLSFHSLGGPENAGDFFSPSKSRNKGKTESESPTKARMTCNVGAFQALLAEHGGDAEENSNRRSSRMRDTSIEFEISILNQIRLNFILNLNLNLQYYSIAPGTGRMMGSSRSRGKGSSQRAFCPPTGRIVHMGAT